MTGQQGTYLFVVNQDGTAQAHPVTVERTNGAYTVLSQGVQSGDQVVTDGQLRIVSGAPVEVKGAADGAPEAEADK
jgi:multidrug efflux system membrane fusion protein